LPSRERERGEVTADAQCCENVDVLARRERDPTRDDRRRDPGQVLALDSLGRVLGGRVRDLVPEHRREPCVGPRHGQDPGVDDDLAAGQAVRVGLLLAKERHLPDERRLVASRHGLDPLCDTLNLVIGGARGDDAMPGLAERLRVLLAPELHLLLVRQADALGAMCHGCRLAVREAEVQNRDDDRC